MRYCHIDVPCYPRQLGEGELWFLEVLQWVTDHVNPDLADRLIMKVETDVARDKSHFNRNQRTHAKTFIERQ